MNKMKNKAAHLGLFFNFVDLADAKKRVDCINDHDYIAKRISEKENQKPLKVVNEVDAGQAHIYLDDVISKYYGISAADITDALNDVDGKDVVLHINCGGGDVMQAREICSAISNHKGMVIAQIDALCASAATFIACACDSVSMNDGGLYMIHNASSFCWGDASAMKKQAEVLDKITASIADNYVDKTGIEKSELLQMMDDETFLTATEALDQGFVDGVFKASKSRKTDQQDEAENNEQLILNEQKIKHAKSIAIALELSAQA